MLTLTAEGDYDRDGLNNLDEYLAGTNPGNFDTDGDLLPDAWEILYGFNPLVGDQDGNAAWFIDKTPLLDEEFEPLGDTGTLRAVDARAVERIDLLSVVEHELGHLAGLADMEDLSSVMGRGLTPGIRRSVR